MNQLKEAITYPPIALIIAIIVILLIVGTVGANDAIDNRTAPVTSFECPAGQTCRILWGAGSTGYNLCAGANGEAGRFDLEIYGADSNRVDCVRKNE